MKKWMKIAGITIVAGAVVVGAYLQFQPNTSSAASSVSTATVQRGSLSATVNAAGNIQAQQTANLTFDQNGTVEKINVEVGDRVKAGDVLAEVDTSDLELSLRTAQVNLKNAQIQLAQTVEPSSEEDIANARATLASAQANYDDVAAGATKTELAAAQAALTSAQAAYNAAVKTASTSDNSLVSASATLEKALIALEKAQGEYDKVSWRGDVAASSQSQSLQSATIDYDSAKAAYDALAATSKTDANSKIAAAASSLQSAQASLAKLEVTDAELAAAEATLTQARNSLTKLLEGPDENELALAQNSVETAQIALDQAQLKLEQSRLVAPFDGVITAISINLGQMSNGTAMTIADLDNLEIVVNMSEVDINEIEAGQRAEITLDAVADASLAGEVSLIAPAGVQSSGVVNYPVTVALTDASDSVKTGMTANLNIVVDERTNVLLVPNRAVKTVNKQKTVTVMFEGQQISVPVQVGLSDSTMTEITEGLKEGDVVVVSTTTTKATTSGGMGVGGMGGPPPGM